MTKLDIEKKFEPEDGTIIIEPCEVYGNAIVGISEDRQHLIYDYNEMVAALAADYAKNKSDLNEDDKEEFCFEAVEWIETNTIPAIRYTDPAYVPIIMLSKDNL